MDKIEFDTFYNGTEVKLYVRRPTLKETREGQKIYNKAFADALESKAYVRLRLNEILEEQGLWGPEQESKFASLRKEISELELRLEKGGIKLFEARKIAISLKKLRGDLMQLTMPRLNLDSNSAEGLSDQARFEYLVSVCVFYTSGERFYKDLDDYLNRASETSSVYAAKTLSKLLFNTEQNWEDLLPENKFLRKYKFVNEFNELVDSEGTLVDEDGNKLEFIEPEKVEFQEFLDDDGNPIKENVNGEVLPA